MLVLLPTFEGQLPWMKNFLSSGVFKVLAKLTYCAFLIHGVVQYAYFASEQNTEFGSRDRTGFLFFGIYALTYIAALCIYLMCELPCQNIEEFILFPRFSGLRRTAYKDENYSRLENNESGAREEEADQSIKSSENKWAINKEDSSMSIKHETSIHKNLK